MANGIKIGGFDFDALKIGGDDVDAAYIGDTLVYSGGTPPTPTLQWVEYTVNDTIPADLEIYGVSGTAITFTSFPSTSKLYFGISRRTVEIYIYDDNLNNCYSDAVDRDDVIEIIFGDVSCSDYYTLGSATVPTDTIKLLIYA